MLLWPSLNVLVNKLCFVTEDVVSVKDYACQYNQQETSHVKVDFGSKWSPISYYESCTCLEKQLDGRFTQ